MSAEADLTDQLNEKAEKYVRKCEKYRGLLEAAEAKLGEQSELCEAAKDRQRQDLNATLTNSVLFESYLNRADKQTATLLEKLGDVKAQNEALRQKINTLRVENNGAIQEIERQAVAVRETESKKLLQRDLAKSFNEEREAVEADVRKLKEREKQAKQEFTVSLELARKIHKQKASEEGRKLSQLRKDRKQYVKQANQKMVSPSKGPAARGRATKPVLSNANTANADRIRTQTHSDATVLSKVNKLREACTDTRVKSQAEAEKILKEISGLDNFDDVAEEFVRLGDEHVRAMKYYNLVHEEYMMLLDEKGRLQDRVELLQNTADKAAKEKAAVKKLKADIEETKKKDKAQQALLAKQYNILEMTKSVVFRCFLVVGCDDVALRARLEAAGVTDENVLQILGIVEHRVQQYIFKQGTNAGTLRIAEKNHDHTIRIVPPNTNDSESEDDSLQPVSHAQVLEELRSHAVNKSVAGKPSALP